MFVSSKALRVIFGVLMAVSLGFATATPARANDHLLPPSEISEDGLHMQPWFHQSFLDLKEDIGDAEAQGKRLMIVWEQRGCPYCKKMHEVNLRIPRVVEAMKKDFMVIQLNLWGDREVTDFDGEVLKEKDLANKWRVMFTPTLQFFPTSGQAMAGKSGVDGEVVRIPGYFKPFHFYFLLRYAKTGGYETEPSFQRWLSGIGNKLDEMGVHYDLYADDLPKDLPADL
ncbi:thioredoxin family protein [Magnetovibrio sp.]|uniref:thioredoxin family protein n=1 Tax=Magnetovibrio sp. TaxID=2024836 RepID=UPI002F924817